MNPSATTAAAAADGGPLQKKPKLRVITDSANRLAGKGQQQLNWKGVHLHKHTHTAQRK